MWSHTKGCENQKLRLGTITHYDYVFTLLSGSHCNILSGWKGHIFTKGIWKGPYIGPKTVFERVRGWSSGQSLPPPRKTPVNLIHIKLSKRISWPFYPPPPPKKKKKRYIPIHCAPCLDILTLPTERSSRSLLSYQPRHCLRQNRCHSTERMRKMCAMAAQ